MDSVPSLLLSSWDIRPDVTLALLAAGFLYTLGWRRLRKRGRGQIASYWRLVAYWSGLGILALALMSAIDVLQSLLFFMHMIQHFLLVIIAPVLLLLANPMPFIMWGLPGRARQAVGRLFRRRSAFRQTLRQVTTPIISWFVFILLLLGWHETVAYNASLRYDWLHDIEHISFFVGGLLYWWHVIGAAPRIHKPLSDGFLALYLAGIIPVNMSLSITIVFAGAPLYTHYTTVPRLWGMSVMDDQQLGGLIMWIPGSIVYITASLVVLARIIAADKREAQLAASVD